MDWHVFVRRFPLLRHIAVGEARARAIDGLLSTRDLVIALSDARGRLAMRWLGPTPDDDAAEPWREVAANSFIRMIRFRRWAEVPGAQPYSPDRHYRATRVALRRSTDSEFSVQIVGNQFPLGGAESALARLLTDGMSVGDWVELLNGFIYFFPNEATAARFRARLTAQSGANGVTEILIATAQMPPRLQAMVRISSINGGSVNGMAPRGRNTYCAVRDCDSGVHAAEIVIDGKLSGADLKLIEPKR